MLGAQGAASARTAMEHALLEDADYSPGTYLQEQGAMRRGREGCQGRAGVCAVRGVGMSQRPDRSGARKTMGWVPGTQPRPQTAACGRNGSGKHALRRAGVLEHETYLWPARSLSLLPESSSAMDTPVSEKTHVECLGSSTPSEFCKEGTCKDTACSPPPSACGQDPDPVEDFYPDGGRGWLVVLGCVIFCAATVGWGYVLAAVP
ncbi:hypothetical protein OBBRIDRAFT_833333 [Obba rivulosa]|uniref:Uncharacterized protein n=1 Tax=Obba rivulosa TaxID=1052685 RepID=A0A8E2DMS8_9APHY|nr:hypothetical protein OBBRIDRAFT_833333 [Obba rivulosa]